MDSMFAKTGSGTAGIPIGMAAYPDVPQAPREMNICEKVMTHDQRILSLEQNNAELRANLERLAHLLVEQFGLLI